MSYELPVITTDVEGQSEQVEDGKTGFIINKYDSGRPLASTESRSEFMRAIRVTDHKVVQQLVEKVSILIENRELRRRMGQAGRWEVEHGRFSIKNRNEKLKRIFDEATG
jgi:glycosyltransferase involved in cell wall biosynthesis